MNAVRKTVVTLAALGMSQALASQAAAETITLSCRSDDGSSYTYRINYTSGLIEELNDSGAAYNGAATASISANAIVWSTDYPSSYMTGDNVTHEAMQHWEGHIDRLAGTGGFWRYFEGQMANTVSFSCREATQKF